MTFNQTLRDEMHRFLSRRHDFSLRKLSLCSVLLTLGSTSTTPDAPVWLATPSLLYLVPLIALAFDLHIVAEDHRVKRAGVFLRDHTKRGASLERAYEKFVAETTNSAAPLTLAAVTFIMLLASAVLLWPLAPNGLLFSGWLLSIVAAEAMLVSRSARVRTQLSRTRS